ncbi:hypothetical protein C8Q73DRAFT_296934 [Cubamyces lactineus]|nr:hypothetical protein C8Q73DRAFT_296934 [Cubamyces lactineus]
MGRVLHRRASSSRRKKASSAEAASTKPGKSPISAPSPVFPPQSHANRPNTRAASRQSTASGGSMYQSPTNHHWHLYGPLLSATD